MHVRTLFLAIISLLGLPMAFAQNAPALTSAAYTAVSSTSMGVTGDIRTTPAALIFNGHTFPLRLQKPYAGGDLENVAKMFSADTSPDSTAALYRISIPGRLKLANGNTFCGGSPTTFVVLLQKGADLEIAGFSGQATPDVSPVALGNSTSLCGTYGYTRK